MVHITVIRLYNGLSSWEEFLSLAILTPKSASVYLGGTTKQEAVFWVAISPILASPLTTMASK
jgi:hypothetical protein